MKRIRLIELRKERGWRQKDVAENVGITVSYYGMIEAGIRTPSLMLGFKIADVYGVPLSEIFYTQKTNKMLDVNGFSATGTEGV